MNQTFGCSPRPRNNPGGSTRKFPTLLTPQKTQQAHIPENKFSETPKMPLIYFFFPMTLSFYYFANALVQPSKERKRGCVDHIIAQWKI